MSQQNIDFGTFPDDPNADAIRIAFQKVQDNFNQLFATTGAQGVLSVNRTPGAGVTVSTPTGNVIITANIACVQFSTSTLSLGRSPTQDPAAQDSSITASSQTMYINLPTTIANVDIINLNSTLVANTVNVNLALNGNVGSFSGNLTGANLTTSGILMVTGNANVGNVNAGNGAFTSNVSVTSNVTAGNVYANAGTIGGYAGVFTDTVTVGNLYANTGIIQAQYLKGDGSNVTNVTAIAGNSIVNGNSNVYIPTANGNVNISSAGNANIVVVTGTGVNVTGTLNATGNANVGNLGTAQVFATANVTAPQFISNIATGTAPFLVNSSTVVANLRATSAQTATNALAVQQNTSTTTTVYPTFSASSANGNVALAISTGISANLGNSSITATTFVGALSGAATTAGTVTTNAQPNITSVGTLTSLGVNGTVTAVAFTANTGVFTGNGNGLSSLVAANITGTITSATNAAALLQNTSTATTVYPTFTTSSANGNSSAVINTSISANLGNASITATTFVGALSGAATTAGTVTTNAQPNITSVGTLTSLGVNGTVTAVAFTANTGVFTGNGNGLSSLVGANVTGTVATATSATNAAALLQNTSTATTVYPTFTTSSANGNSSAVLSTGISANLGNSSITATTFVGALSGAATTAGSVTTNAQANITSVGTLTGLGVNGTLQAVNITANTGVFTGNGNGLSSIVGANVTGQVGNSAIAGTVYTNAQPNITSVGSLTALTVTGNVNAGNANLGNLTTSNYFAGVLTTAAQPNITSVGTLTALTVTGNLASGNANLGNLAKANFFQGDGGLLTNVSVSAGSSILNGNSNVSVAANSNVTISVAGNANIVTVTGTGANITGYANVTGNVNAGNVIATLLTGNLSTAAQPNITSLGTLTGLNVAGVSNLGPNSNLIITGGVNGAFLKTNGSGNLVWDTGTLNPAQGANTQVIFNDGGTTYAGNANLTFNKTTGALTVGGNANVGNIGATNGVFSNITGALTTNAQPNITSVGSLTSLIVQGNINAANITVAAGTITANLFSGNANSLSNIPGANVTGTVPLATSATTAGTVTTNAQPNITSVGTLTTLNTGFIYAGAGTPISSTTATIQSGGDIYLLASGAQSIVYDGYYSSTGGANWKYATTGQYVGAVRFDGTAGKMQIWTSTNTGTAGANADVVPRVTVDNIGNVGIGNASPTHTLSVAGTMNITGNANIGNIGTSQVLASANVTTPQLISNIATGTAPLVVTSTTQVANLSVATAGTAGTVTTNAQPNITSVGTLSSLSVTGNTVSGNILGVHANGNSNVNIPSANGNVNISAVGNANILVVTGTGANITGTANVTGNATINGTRVGLGNVTINTSAGLGSLLNSEPGLGSWKYAKLFSTATQTTTPDSIFFKPDGLQLYLTSSITGAIWQYTLGTAWDISTASFTRTAAISTATGLWFKPDGLKMYICLNNPNYIYEYSLSVAWDISTLTFAQLYIPSQDLLPEGISFNSTGTTMWMLGNTNDTVYQYTLSTAWNLSTISYASKSLALPVESNYGLFVDSTSTYVYITGDSSDTVYMYTMGTPGDISTATLTSQQNFGLFDPIPRTVWVENAQNKAYLVGDTFNTIYQITTNLPGFIVSNPSNTAQILGNLDVQTNLTVNGICRFEGEVSAIGQIRASAPAGTAPFVVSSTTFVSNLNVNYVSGYGVSTASNINTLVARDANANIAGNNISGANIIATSFYVHSVATGISAAGTVQANATALTKDFNVVSTVISGANSVTLPTAVAGYRITIINTSANALNVYPLGNGIINTQAANVAYSQPAGAKLDFICTATATAPGGQWYTLNATYG